MAYFIQRLIAYAALAALACFYYMWTDAILRPDGSLTLQSYCVLVYIVVGLIPHRFIAPVRWRFRLVMAFHITAFAILATPKIWPLFIPGPLALNLSRMRFRIRKTFRRDKEP